MVKRKLFLPTAGFWKEMVLASISALLGSLKLILREEPVPMGRLCTGRNNVPAPRNNSSIRGGCIGRFSKEKGFHAQG